MGKRVKQAAVDRLGLPGDVILGEVQIFIQGGQNAVIENYRSILSYSQDRLVVLTKNGRVALEGAGLQIEYYDEDSMKIKGRICRVELEER